MKQPAYRALSGEVLELRLASTYIKPPRRKGIQGVGTNSVDVRMVFNNLLQKVVSEEELNTSGQHKRSQDKRSEK